MAKYLEELSAALVVLEDTKAMLRDTYGLDSDWITFDEPDVHEHYQNPSVLQVNLSLRFKKYADDTQMWYSNTTWLPYPLTTQDILIDISNCIESLFSQITMYSQYTYGYNDNRHFDFDKPSIVTQLYDIKAQKNPNNTFALLAIRNKITNATIDSCFRYDKKVSEWIATNPKQKVFMLMRLGDGVLSELTFCTKKEFGHPVVDYEKAIVWLLENVGTSDLCEYTILDKSSTEIKFVHHTANYISGNKNRDAYVAKSCTQHHIYIDNKGKIQKRSKNLPIPAWLECINTAKDFVKNPYNVEAHDHLNAAEIPLYESEVLYVTSNNDFYIRTDLGWVLTDKEWFLNDPSKLSEDMRTHVNRYGLMKQLLA